jgi:hypothetical protein
MKVLIIVIVVIAALLLIGAAMSVRIVKQYEKGVLHPLALQLRNLQSLVEIGVDKNTTVVFPAPLMTTIAELGAFLTREQAAATPAAPLATAGPPPHPASANGSADGA